MKQTKTTMKSESIPNWVLVDATGVRLGKLASFVAQILQGKNKATYTPHIDTGSSVVIINTKELDYHPRREEKIYSRHSGYPGGYKEITFKDLLKKNSNEVVKKAIWGMMPKTKLGKVMMQKLYLYETSEHKHEAQQPVLAQVS